VVVYRRLVELAPDDVDHWSGLALAQYGVGDVEGSAATYGRILERWPDDWHAHTNLALLLMDRTYRTIHDPAAALYHGRRAVELNPEHWNLRVNLAEVTARCGDRREAADMFAELARQSDAGSTQQRLYADRARHLRK
jgi:Flp pilus assembly protein TadD